MLWVVRYQQGSAQTPWRWKWFSVGDEGLLLARVSTVIPATGQIAYQPLGVPWGAVALCVLSCAWVGTGVHQFWNTCLQECSGSANPNRCMMGCLIDAVCGTYKWVDPAACAGCGACIGFVPVMRPICMGFGKQVFQPIGKMVVKVVKYFTPTL